MESELKATIAETVEDAHDAAKEAVRTPWGQRLSQFGFFVKGFIFVVIGISAIALASGLEGGRISDPIGAMAAIAQFRFGILLVAIVAIGAVMHGVWNILRGFVDIDKKGKKLEGLITRIFATGVGLFYFVLAGTALSILVSGGGEAAQNGENEKLIANLFLSIPLGAVVILIIALGFFGAAIHECYSGISGKFQEPHRSWELGKVERNLVWALGVISFVTRSVLYVIVGYFFFLAANLNDPRQADGLDGALLAIAQSRYGSILLFACGFGLLCHGILAFIEAKYRRIC